MNIFKVALNIFLLYILYKFIFGFVIPVYRNAKLMSKKMKEMQDRMQQQEQQTSQFNGHQNAQKQPRQKSEPAGEYIDYEEIK